MIGSVLCVEETTEKGEGGGGGSVDVIGTSCGMQTEIGREFSHCLELSSGHERRSRERIHDAKT